MDPKDGSKRWIQKMALAVLIFSEGFAYYNQGADYAPPPPIFWTFHRICLIKCSTFCNICTYLKCLRQIYKEVW